MTLFPSSFSFPALSFSSSLPISFSLLLFLSFFFVECHFISFLPSPLELMLGFQSGDLILYEPFFKTYNKTFNIKVSHLQTSHFLFSYLQIVLFRDFYGINR